ncbi:hypothetical protein HDU86_003408 [Geranomyces michiganensis]|nr:hypothetical protein HDU86_003408 [Geranomyces michiganensis]
MNVLLGYEQANKYAIKNSRGEDVGYIAEEETKFTGVIARQLLRTRRPFKADVLDRDGKLVLKIDRPIKYLLSSTIFIRDEHDNEIGEIKQVWNLLRRKYDLFWKGTQFGYIDVGTLAWHFSVLGEDGKKIAAVNRDFGGFAREIFTDTGAYAIHLDDEVDKENPGRPISLDERALLLACAVQIDIDYYSRHSSHGGGFMPFGMFGGGSAPPAVEGENNPVAGVGPASGVGAVGEAGAGAAVGAGAGSVFGAAAGGAGSAGAAPGPAPSSPPDGNPWGDPAPPPSGGNVWGDSAPPPPPSGGNAWGDSPFLSDEEAAGNAGEGAGNWFDGFFDD